MEEAEVAVVGDKTKFVFFHLIMNKRNIETLMKRSFHMIAAKTECDLNR